MSDKENIVVSTSTVVSENENEYEHAGDSGKTTAGLNEDRLERLRESARDLPYQPGVYIMHNREGKIIYIGKSKSLHNRVCSYFFSVHHSTKTARMVDSVWYFEYILTDTEIEALALENRLIKLHAPRYNIRLKDCKSYPYIKVDLGLRYPTVTVTRSRLGDRAKYFGPYSGTDAAYTILRTVQTVFGVPSCKRSFPRDIGKERPCLYAQMGRCIAPCSGKVSEEEYGEMIHDVLTFLRGSFSDVRRSLTERMNEASENLFFESAAIYRDRINALSKLWQKQKVVGAPGTEYDVFGLCEDEANAAVSVFYVRDGSITDRDSFNFGAGALLDSGDIAAALCELYSRREYVPTTVLLDFKLEPDDIALLETYLEERAGRRVHVRMPERGEQKQLCVLATENSSEFLRRSRAENAKNTETLVSLAQLLALEVVPERIEAFDISNMGNDNITAGMIACVGGRFEKKLYRSYAIRSTGGRQDDYASMREAMHRRYQHPEDGMPDLILVDGGEGHVSVARAQLEADGIDIPVFGMVKDSFHKTRAITDGEREISIARSREVYNLIFRIQEEVHRFTVSRMSGARRKSLRHSSLEAIPGIGPAKAKMLLSYFGTLSALSRAEEDAIASAPGITRRDAAAVRAYFDEKNGAAHGSDGKKTDK